MKRQPPQEINGTIVRYAGNGRKLGYPTANLDAGTDLDDGVYFGWATLGKKTRQPALIFIGVPTTIGDTQRRVEAHILDLPDKDYYGQKLELDVAYFHRPNQKFDSIDDLLVAMKADEVAARSWFEQH
jgi:riboflavin kinase / FMN adenylyltransferase